ncbi:unnamed protein product [Camellia sinensis]
MEKFGLPDILKSKHEENEAYISELEQVFNNNELSGKIPSTKRTTADFGDIHKWTIHVWGISDNIHLCSSFNFEEEVMTIVETSGSPTRLQGKFKQKPPWPWFAMMISIGILVIALLLGHIINVTVNHIAKVEDDYHEMMELKKRAEAADVAKSQFLATVSHEIRTPMNGVLDG